MAAGELDLKARDKLLVEMTPDVATHVLLDNYRQSMALTHAELRAPETIGEAARFIRSLERAGALNRAVEFLPDDEELEERRARRQGLTRPEIAVLLAYAKMTLYNDLLASGVPDDPWLVKDIGLYFPPLLSSRYAGYIDSHRLRLLGKRILPGMRCTRTPTCRPSYCGSCPPRTTWAQPPQSGSTSPSGTPRTPSARLKTGTLPPRTQCSCWRLQR